MNLLKNKGTLLGIILGLLISAASSQSTASTEEDVASIKLELQLLKDSYKQLCNHYLASNCSDLAEFKCTQCPAGWFHVGDQCFRLFTDRHNFFDSKIRCAENDAHLATLSTAEQHDVVEKEGRRIGTLYTYYFIGLTDIENEGEWKWMDNSTLTVPFWKTTPDNSDNQPANRPKGGDCVVVESYNQQWYDVPCDFEYPRVCQRKATLLK